MGSRAYYIPFASTFQKEVTTKEHFRSTPGPGEVLHTSIEPSDAGSDSALSNPPVMKLPSSTRFSRDDNYNVEEMAKMLKEELKDCTYRDDPNLLINIFRPHEMPLFFNTPDELLRTLSKSDGHRPGYWNRFFDSVATIDSTGQHVPSSSPPTMQTGFGHEFRYTVEGDDTSEKPIGDPPDTGQDDEEDEDQKITDELEFRVWFNFIAMHLDLIAASQKRPQSQKRFNSSYSDKFMDTTTGEKRKPDMVLIPALSGSENLPFDGDWRSVYIVYEISRQKNFSPRIKKQVNDRAAFLFYHQPGRLFVPIVAVSGRQFMLSVFHRSGVVHSAVYDMVYNLYYFYYILIFLLFAPLETLGFAPNITYSTSLQPLTIKVNKKTYQIDKEIYVREGIQGRGTCCWSVRPSDDPTKVLVVKISWVEILRYMTELTFLKWMRAIKMRGVPVLVAYEDFETTGRWKPVHGNKKFIERTLRVLVLDGFGRHLSQFSTKQELLSGVIDILEVHGVLCIVLGLVHRDMSLWNLFLVDQYPDYVGHLLETSEEESLSTMPPGQMSATHPESVDEIEDDSEISDDEMENSSKTDIDLFSHSLVAHSRGFARGLLSDFDNAATTENLVKVISSNPGIAHLLSDPKRNASTRTGNLAFMATEVLLGSTKKKKYYHTAAHDFETVAYDLMAICIHQAGPHGQMRDLKKDKVPKSVYSGVARLPTAFMQMRDLSPVELGMSKPAIWNNLEEWVLPCFHTYFDDMKDLFIDLRDVLWPLDFKKTSAGDYNPRDYSPRDYARRINSPATHEQVIGVFRKYLEIVKETVTPKNPEVQSNQQTYPNPHSPPIDEDMNDDTMNGD